MLGMTERYFSFLLLQGFKGPFDYNYKREHYTDYIRKDIIIHLIYEGSYVVYVIKTKTIIPGLETGTKKVIDLESKDKNSFDLSELDPNRKLFKSVDFNDMTEKYLWYYSRLLRDNPEILDGDMTKFNLINYLLKRLGLKK
jgi:hypothetical protein